jgi:glycosyltransferase involved in cell wall biosynthesis
MKKQDRFVSVIAPLYNDSKTIQAFITEVMEILRDNFTNFELVLINDASEDDTGKKVINLLSKYECIRLINLSRHFGTEVAICSGLDSVIGDFNVVLLPESDPPTLIPQLVAQACAGTDLLIGVRQKRRGEPWWMNWGANIFYWLCQKVFKIPLIKNSTHYRVLSRQMVNSITQIEDKYRYLRLLDAYVGYHSEVFTYQPIWRARRNRFSHPLEAMNLGLQIIFVNSLNPLRIASLLSLLVSLLNLLYLVYVFLIYLLKEKVAEGWVTLSTQNSLMFFLLSLVLAILCEYVGLMFAKLRGWSSYYIANEVNSSVLVVNPEQLNVVEDSENVHLK